MFLLLSLTAAAESFSCGLAAGGLVGFIDVRDQWELVNRGPFLPTGSPMIGLGCQPPVYTGEINVSAELAPWPIHFRMSEERQIRQWITTTASWSAVFGAFSVGPALTGGNAGVGCGLRAGYVVNDAGARVNLRLLNFLTDPEPNLQVVVLYSFRPMSP